MMDADNQLYVTLNTGAKMPLLAFGTLMETITVRTTKHSKFVSSLIRLVEYEKLNRTHGVLVNP